MLKYCLDKYKTPEIRDKTLDDFLPALKFVPNCFVTSKMIKKLDDALFSNDDILFLMKILVLSQFLLTKSTSFCDFSDPKCFYIYRPKLFNTCRPKCFDSPCK